MISQIAIAIFGASAIWFVGRKEHWKRWGYIFGLISQPFWFYTAYTNEQWGILAMCLFYTYSWLQGFINYWIKVDEPIKKSTDNSPIKIEDFHIGFQYEEYQMDSERYLNKGMIWVRKTYTLTSPRLYKIQKLIDERKVRKIKL